MQGYQAPLYIKYINDCVKFGAFADADISQDTMIGEYTGKLVKQDDITDISSQATAYFMDYPMVYRLGDSDDTYGKLFIDAKEYGNFTRFINHSYTPNVRSKLKYLNGLYHWIFLADENIKKDTQLLVDYGKSYWDNQKMDPKEF